MAETPSRPQIPIRSMQSIFVYVGCGQGFQLQLTKTPRYGISQLLLQLREEFLRKLRVLDPETGFFDVMMLGGRAKLECEDPSGIFAHMIAWPYESDADYPGDVHELAAILWLQRTGWSWTRLAPPGVVVDYVDTQSETF